jgi:hypothetical protein
MAAAQDYREHILRTGQMPPKGERQPKPPALATAGTSRRATRPAGNVVLM